MTLYDQNHQLKFEEVIVYVYVYFGLLLILIP